MVHMKEIVLNLNKPNKTNIGFPIFKLPRGTKLFL